MFSHYHSSPSISKKRETKNKMNFFFWKIRFDFFCPSKKKSFRFKKSFRVFEVKLVFFNLAFCQYFEALKKSKQKKIKDQKRRKRRVVVGLKDFITTHSIDLNWGEIKRQEKKKRKKKFLRKNTDLEKENKKQKKKKNDFFNNLLFFLSLQSFDFYTRLKKRKIKVTKKRERNKKRLRGENLYLPTTFSSLFSSSSFSPLFLLAPLFFLASSHDFFFFLASQTND